MRILNEGRFNFDFHVNKVCHYMNKKKQSILMNAFITSQFSDCPLVWMFHSKTVKNRINKIHEKTL